MIVIKIYNKKEQFIGYFSYSSVEYIKKSTNNKFYIKSFRPLLSEAYLFNEEDLFNNVIKEHINEIIKFFKFNSLFKGYSLKLVQIKEEKELYEYN